MRISLLEKREDFYKILQETLESSSFFKKDKDREIQKYFVNKYLNFIAQKSTNSKAFENLKKEYSTAIKWQKKLFQKVYVALAITKLFRSFFAQKVILMPKYGDFIILGGNHRLRLFSEDLFSTWSILKKGERLSYIKNDIAIRTQHKLSYIPNILSTGDEWLEEEYFSGMPLNRLKDANRFVQIEQEIVQKHREELLNTSKRKLSNSAYSTLVKEEIETISQSQKVHSKEVIIAFINTVLDKLLSQLNKEEIDVSWTHGDFQMANILVNDNQVKVIDWESASERYTLYDFFVLFGEVRTGIPLASSVSKFQEKTSSLGFEIGEQEVLLCLIEELRFQVCEDFSENFYFSGEKTNHLCAQILEYIHE